MKLMLLCAGEGTRLRPHTLKLPKPAIPFLTAPMAAYSLEWAREIAASRLVVNTYHLPDRIHALFNGLAHDIPELVFSDEQPNLMGPGGGIMKASPLLSGGDFLVMNGDEIFLPDSAGQLIQALKAHRDGGAIATICVMRYPGVGTKFGGVWADSGGRVHGFGKSALHGTEGWHFTGAIFFSQGIFSFLPKDRPSNFLYDGLAAAIAAGLEVRTHRISGWWHETGSPPDYLEATAESVAYLTEDRGYASEFLKTVLKRHVPTLTWHRDAAGTLVRADGGDGGDFKVKGFGVLGRGSSFAPGSENKDAVLGDGVSAKEPLENALEI